MRSVFETSKIELLRFLRGVRHGILLAPGILALITLWERFF